MIERNMIERTPPRLATWLLKRWSSPYHGESLAGDLFEQYRQGASRAWYWRQVAAAVLIGRGRFLRAMPWSAACRLLSRLVAESAAVLAVLMLAFGVIALGVGTLTWAGTLRDARPPTCIGPGH
jgi:hypothetical protein